MKEVPVWEKTTLTLEEAAAYTGIGENRLIEHQRHRFRKRTGERAQTFALAARHDHRKHRKNLP